MFVHIINVTYIHVHKYKYICSVKKGEDVYNRTTSNCSLLAVSGYIYLCNDEILKTNFFLHLTNMYIRSC
jgi:hypothetical protein